MLERGSIRSLQKKVGGDCLHVQTPAQHHVPNQHRVRGGTTNNAGTTLEVGWVVVVVVVVVGACVHRNTAAARGLGLALRVSSYVLQPGIRLDGLLQDSDVCVMLASRQSHML